MIAKSCAFLLLVLFSAAECMTPKVPRLPLASIINNVAHKNHADISSTKPAKKESLCAELSRITKLWKSADTVERDVVPFVCNDLLVDFNDNYFITLGKDNGALWRRANLTEPICQLDGEFKKNHEEKIKSSDEMYQRLHKSFGFIYRIHTYNKSYELLVTALEKQITLWDTQTKTLLKSFFFAADVKSICMSDEDNAIAIQLENNTIEILTISFE